MRCISRSITLLVSAGALAMAGEGCVLVDGGRIRAGDLAVAVPAFAAMPAERDLAPAPAGTLVRIFTRVQLAALAPGFSGELPDRVCVQRRREAIPPEAWQAAVEAALTKMCGQTAWKAKVLEAPMHRFPMGELVFHRSGLTAGRGATQLWRGAVLLPDKSTVPVWVRVDVQTRRSALLLRTPVAAGAAIGPEDYRTEEIWAPGVCVEAGDAPRPDWMLARHAMQAGAELRKEDLRFPPAVQRGQTVELEAGTGPARLRVPAVAEHDAAVGEMVPMKSGWNGSRLVGRVTGERKARVE